jgi:hypothetical protein
LAAERLEAELDAERAGNEGYEHYRATGRDKQGRRLSRPPKPYTPPQAPEGKDGNPHPEQAPPPPNRHRRGLKGPSGGHTAAHDEPVTSTPPTGGRRRQPPRPLSDSLLASRYALAVTKGLSSVVVAVVVATITRAVAA